MIDIHTGGEDNIFPHHECEIAQSRGVTGKPHFARYWLHGRHLRVEREKMSKSLKNFYTVSDVLGGEVTGREVHPGALRLELIKTHYRAGSNFTAQGLIDCGRMVERLTKLREAAQQATHAGAEGPDTRAQVGLEHPVISRFVAALADDLNMSEALAVLFEWLNGLGDSAGNPRETLAVLERIDSVLAVLPAKAAEDVDPEATGFARQIDAARAARDFKTADAIRQRLLDAGYRVLTTKDGTKVEKPLA
jgi:cysteinyl-tRNA synthetase